jgi:hypothetical protein
MSEAKELPSLAEQFMSTIVDFVNKNRATKYENYPPDWRIRMDRINTALGCIAANVEVYRKNCLVTWHDQVLTIYESILTLDRDEAGKEYYSTLNQVMKSTFLLVYEKTTRTSLGDNDVDKINKQEMPILTLLLEQEENVTSKERMLATQWVYALQRAMHMNDIERSRATTQDLVNKVNETEKEAKGWTKVWNEKLETYKAEVKSIGERVDGVAGKQNFVSLAEAFNNLIESKKAELTAVDKRLLWMALAVLAPLVLSFVVTTLIWLLHENPAAELKDKIIYFAPVIIPLEVVLIYFFRIFLKEQLSLKGQILQLELRYGVCAFIKGYAEFVKTIGDNKLDKFEALIFSGITPDPTAVPGTFDGMEQLAGLVQKLQK